MLKRLSLSFKIINYLIMNYDFKIKNIFSFFSTKIFLLFFVKIISFHSKQGNKSRYNARIENLREYEKKIRRERERRN